MSASKLPRQASLSSSCSEPGQRIKILIDYGSQVEVDKTLPLKLYFRSGHELLRIANMYCDDGQLESAFILYYKFITLFVEKLPSHQEYQHAPHNEVMDFKRKVKRVFPIAEEIKSKLKKRYTEDEHIYQEQQRRLAAERAAEEENRRKKVEEQERQDEELARKLQEEEEAEMKNKQDEKYWKLRMQEEEKLKEEEQRKNQARDSGIPYEVQNGSRNLHRIPETAADNIPDQRMEGSIDAGIAAEGFNVSDAPQTDFSNMPPPPSYSAYLDEIAADRPQVPDRELKKKLFIGDINIPPQQPVIPSIDRSNKPAIDHHMSLGEFGGMKVGQLRTVVVPSLLMSKFLSAAAGNTSKESETMGILCGKLSQGVFKITNLYIPQQKGTHDSCDMENEEELIVYQDNHNLITLGWIHTHPTQTAFLSSVDLHSHFPWQKMMPEAIAIVCSPKYEETGIFKLTDHGLDVIGRCREKGFHPHNKDPPLFETCNHVQVSDKDTIVVENKMK
uniref:MPN domain-containing protein n=1 Tax=Arion vulgaris TaxID=1028688 RepID=A0A0B6YUP4_9EUPU